MPDGRHASALGARLRIFWALRGTVKLAGLLGFACGQRVSITNIVSDERYWDLRPNDLVHWEFVKWASAEGYRYFDFGSVRYGGQRQFKSKWGCVLADSGYYFLAPHGAGAAQETFDSSSGTMQAASKLWARLMPPEMAQRLGPVLRRNLMR